MADRDDADLSNLHVVVPVRGPADGKSRLGFALDAEEREALVVGMLEHTLDTLAAWTACRTVHVVTADARLAEIVARRDDRRVRILADTADNLNAALRLARAAALADGATAIAYLPADLPLLSTAALEGLSDAADAALAAGGGGSVVVIAPADARGGTNALLIAPPGAIDPCFGEASLEAHLRAAAAADVSLQVVIDAALGFDLDTPDDLERLEVARLVELQRIGQEALSALSAAAL